MEEGIFRGSLSIHRHRYIRDVLASVYSDFILFVVFFLSLDIIPEMGLDPSGYNARSGSSLLSLPCLF